MKKSFILLTSFVVLTIFATGCASNKAKIDHFQDEETMLKAKLRQLQLEKDSEAERLAAEKARLIAEKAAKEQELSDLEKAKLELEESLKQELGEYKAKLEMTERGLVITFLSEIFFDSGKDVITLNGEEPLGKVALVLNNNVPDSLVAVEGHTDNDPIKYSGWKSNWELSTARALAVLHYLTDKGSVSPERLSAVGYGEYHPVANNDTAEGKQKNRRVEIVILPAAVTRVAAE